MAFLSVKNIAKTFDSKVISALSDVSFSMKKGEIFSLIGPSGTGKSTLAKIIAGLSKADSGEIDFNGTSISYVPQELSLDNDLSVFENIKSSLGDISDEQAHHPVREMIEVFGLQYKDHKFPNELSTGQKQRVEIAKAFVKMPDLVIFDEPFSNLDRPLRNEIKQELYEYLSEKEISAIFVTHDLDEALNGPSRVMLLGDGCIKQNASPREIYLNPTDTYVAKFLGPINLFASKKISDSTYQNSFGEFNLDKKVKVDSAGYFYIGLRPESIVLKENGSYKGKVEKINFSSALQIISVKSKDQNPILISCSPSLSFSIGQKVSFSFNVKECLYLAI